MTIDPTPLSVTNSMESLADWLEIRTLRDPDGNGSGIDLLTALRISGTTDAVDDEEGDGRRVEKWEDPCEAAVEGAFTEIEDRFRACGADAAIYPFEMAPDYLALTAGTRRSVYTFLLLLSRYGDRAGPKANLAVRLFEDVCAKVAESYLGGNQDTIRSHVFGFPRRVLPSGFGAALDQLCSDLNEGAGARNRPNSSDQQDAKLDIVAWRDFEDSRPGKLIAFGQCATGHNWRSKLSELQPVDWCGLWMKDRPAVYPVRMFFAPHRIGMRTWYHDSVCGGVLFDRCRIARHSALLPSVLRDELAAWSEYVLDSIGAQSAGQSNIGG